MKNIPGLCGEHTQEKQDIFEKFTKHHMYYTIKQWENLSQQEKQFLLSQNGNSKFNPTNENIEWARYSWNPITGCLHNCAYCYARDIANRFYSQKFEPAFLPDRLTAPQNTKQRDLGQFDNSIDKMGYRNVFTCSMADLFGKWIPADWIQAVLKSIANNPQWTFLLLTKFPIRMAEFSYPNNVWLGTTVDYQWSVERAEKAFIKIKNSGFDGVCWLSCEPMMEQLTFSSLKMFDWVVMGGSSKSTQTPEYKPPFDDIIHLYNQARNSNCKVYQKTNLIERVREYP
jgi:protein gp37